MFTVAEKHVVMGSDFAGFGLKDAIKHHLVSNGWTVLDITPIKANTDMYHRVGFALGSKIAEGEYERALAFCGTGMGIHIAASKVPHVHSAVAESIHGARRAVTANNCNLLAMGGFWIGPSLGIAMAEAFLGSVLGAGYEEWEGFLEYHQLGYRECEEFDYQQYKENGFQIVNARNPHLGPEPTSLAF